MFSNDKSIEDLFSVFQFDEINQTPPDMVVPSDFHVYLTNALYDNKTGPLHSYLNQIFSSNPLDKSFVHDFIKWTLSPPLKNVPVTHAVDFLEWMTERAVSVDQFYFAAKCAFAKALILTNHCWNNHIWLTAAEAWKKTFSLYTLSNAQGLNPHVSQQDFFEELSLGHQLTWKIIFRGEPDRFADLLEKINEAGQAL